MPADPLAVHGLTAEFLADKPLFGAIADEFLAFVGDAPCCGVAGRLRAINMWTRQRPERSN
jgi:DNA polymerase III epsilon subunit-like protein